MKKLIAVPMTNGQLSAHFGHCEQFSIITIDGGKIVNEDLITPPPHEPGLLPKFLSEKGVNVIIAGGMGSRAQELFTQNNIEVNYGVSAATSRELVEKYLAENLVTGENLCDH